MATAEGLLERGEALAAIGDALASARAAEGSLLLLEGPAGIGKTRLLDATRAAAEEQTFAVHTAHGGQLERDYAYGVVRQLLERAVAAAPPQDRRTLLAGPASHAAAAMGLEAAPGQPTAEDQSFAVRHGLYWLVANLAAAGPVLLAVDDAQWADAPSLRFLAYLARRLEGLPILLAITVRTGDPATDEGLLAQVTVAAGRRLAPAPLSAGATGEVLRGRTGGPVDPGFAEACHAATGGNPFLVGELGAALVGDGIAPVAANAAQVERIGPRTVARSLVLRLGRVSEATLRYARAVSVLGASADPRHAAALAGVDPEEARAADDTLVTAGVLARERPRASPTPSCARRSTATCRRPSRTRCTAGPPSSCARPGRRRARSPRTCW